MQHTLRQIHTVHQIMHNRHFREPEMALLKFLVSAGDVVADVGANVGVYTKELSLAVGPQGKVYSFEPVGETHDILTAVIRRAGLQNVSPFHAAIGSKLTECEIVIPDMDGFTGYYWAHLAQAQDQGRRETVKVLTLDELCNNGTIHHLDFIKCDVEGAELEVIMGGLDNIRTQTPGWLIEVSKKTSEQVFSVLRGIGYRAFVFDGRLIETQAYRDAEFSNYFFLHPRSRSWARALSHFC